MDYQLLVRELVALVDDLEEAKVEYFAKLQTKNLDIKEYARLKRCAEFGEGVVQEAVRNCPPSSPTPVGAVPAQPKRFLSDPSTQMFLGDVLFSAIGIIQSFGSRAVYREVYNAFFIRAFTIVFALFSPVDSQSMMYFVDPAAKAGVYLYHLMSEAANSPNTGENAPNFGGNSNSSTPLDITPEELDLPLGDFFLSKIAQQYDIILRIAVNGHYREKAKLTRYEKQRLGGLNVDKQRKLVDDYKLLSQLMWKVFVSASQSPLYAQPDPSSLSSPSNAAINHSIAANKIVDLENILELAGYDVDITVRMIKILLDVDPGVAFCLAQLWDSTKNVEAVKKLMINVQEVMTGCILDQSQKTPEAATYEGTIKDVYEFKKKLCYLFIDEDILFEMLRQGDKLLKSAVLIQESSSRAQNISDPVSLQQVIADPLIVDKLHKASLLVSAFCRCNTEMSRVCFDDKHYVENDVDLLSNKLANVVNRLIRHLQLKRKDYEAFFRRWVFMGNENDTADPFADQISVGDQNNLNLFDAWGSDDASRNPFAQTLDELVKLPTNEYDVPLLARFWDLALTRVSQVKLYGSMLDALINLKGLGSLIFANDDPWYLANRQLLSDVSFGSSSASSSSVSSANSTGVAAKMFILNIGDCDLSTPEMREKLYQSADGILRVIVDNYLSSAVANSPVASALGESELVIRELVRRYWRIIRKYALWCDIRSGEDSFWKQEYIGSVVHHAAAQYRDLEQGDDMVGTNFPTEVQGSTEANHIQLNCQLSFGSSLTPFFVDPVDPLFIILTEKSVEENPMTETSGHVSSLQDCPPNAGIGSLPNVGNGSPLNVGNGSPLSNITAFDLVPEHLRCAIDGKLMRNPVIVPTKQFGDLRMELDTLKHYCTIRKMNVCPLTNESIPEVDTLTIDQNLLAEIAKF